MSYLADTASPTGWAPTSSLDANVGGQPQAETWLVGFSL